MGGVACGLVGDPLPHKCMWPLRVFSAPCVVLQAPPVSDRMAGEMEPDLLGMLRAAGCEGHRAALEKAGILTAVEFLFFADDGVERELKDVFGNAEEGRWVLSTVRAAMEVQP